MNITLLSQMRVLSGRKHLPGASAVLFAALVFTLSTHAAELQYSTTPLFWATGVQPNVALLIDNSGSMTTKDTNSFGPYVNTCTGATNTTTAELSRIEAVKQAACQTITDNATSMRIALYDFNNGNSQQLLPYGSSASTLKSSINGLSANQNTPLSNALRYIEADYVNDKTSPIQYRCQKNFTVVFTDGLPNTGLDVDSSGTYTLPSMSPNAEQKTTWYNGNAQTGATNGSPNWDGLADPKVSKSIAGGPGYYFPFMDDISQFIYDVDIKTTTSTTPAANCPNGTAPVTGNDCAGKSWDDTAFPKQNVATYTLGFGDEANNELLRDVPLTNQIPIVPANVDTAKSTITITNHGLETGQYVHYYADRTTTTYSITASANTATDVLTGDTTNMTNGDTLTYSNAGGTNMDVVLVTGVPGSFCGDIGGLSSGSTYFVANRSATTLRLATDPAKAALCAADADSAAAVGSDCIDLTSPGVNATTHKFDRAAVSANTMSRNISSSSGTSKIDPRTDVEELSWNGTATNFNTGDLVNYTCTNSGWSGGNCSANQLIGLTNGSNYYVAVTSYDHIRLATSLANAVSCAALADNAANVSVYCIDLSSPSSGTGGIHTFTRNAVTAVSASFVATGAGTTPVNTTANVEKLTFGSNHNLSTSDRVTYTCSGTGVTQVTGSQAAYTATNVVKGNPGTFQIMLTSAGPTPADIFTAGNASQTFTWTRGRGTIGGLYAYENDTPPQATPNPATQPEARGKYYVEVVDPNTIRLHECGDQADCTNGLATGGYNNTGASILTSQGYGILSTGPGRSYFSSNAQQLALDLAAAFKSISANTLSFSAIATTSEQYGSTAFFQAKFNTADWSGDMVALPIDPVSGNVKTTPLWQASQNVPTPYSSRNLLTWIPSTPASFSGGTGATVGTVASLTAAQQVSLGTTTADRQKVLDWVRGKDDLTLAGSRTRSNGVYGDIIGGSPRYVGTPNESYDTILPTSDPGKASYAAYKGISRTPMLYVGANDGMLHGVNANTGAEVFGFIPNAVYTDWLDTDNTGMMDVAAETALGSATSGQFMKFFELTRDDYGQIPAYPHRYFVDGEPVSGDVFFTGAKAGIAANSWHTVVIGGLGKGGRTVYALDVTNPSAITSANVLWEISNISTGGKMGYTYSKPVISRLQTGEWAAIFGNGYDGNLDLGRLWIVNIETGAIIKRIDATGSKGMSSVSVLKDSTGTAVAVYAGDLAGNVWKFDISSSNSGLWVTPVTTPFFTAKDSAGNVQPITSPIGLGSAPVGATCTTGQVCTMLYFGTGTYFQNGDKSYTAGSSVPRSDTFYGLWDNGSGPIPTDKSTLVEQTLSTTLINGVTYRQGSTNAVNYLSPGAMQGWYMQLVVGTAYQGERVVFEPVLIGGVIFFTTIIPASADPCTTSASSWLMGVNATTGQQLNLLFDTNGDGQFTSADTPTNGMLSTGGLFTKPLVKTTTTNRTNSDGSITTDTVAQIYIGHSGNEVTEPGIDHIQALLNSTTVVPPGASPSGRMSWRQLQ